MDTERNHAEDNARSWYESIVEWHEKLDDDKRQERTEELEETISTFEHGDPEAVSIDEYNSAKAELERLNDFDRDDLETEIRESPLSVQIRSGWADAGSELKADEYEILLSTGGPALRIVGDLGQYGEPESARLEHQDWFKPWTEYHEADEADLLWFAAFFYYGN